MKNDNLLSKYHDAIFGFAILYIMFFHASAIDRVDYSFGRSSLRHFCTVMSSGGVGVDVFLFLSGIFLYYSYKKNSLGVFTKRRLVRLYIPLFLIDGTYWLVYILLMRKDLPGFLIRLSGLKFYVDGDQTVWYVSFILLCYFMYPFIHEYIYADGVNTARRTFLLMAGAWLMGWLATLYNYDLYKMLGIAYTRIPVFVLGCGMGRAVCENRQFKIWKWVPFAVLFMFYSVLHFDLLHGCFLRYFYLVGGVSLTYSLAVTFGFLDKIRKGNSYIIKFFSFFGKISLELYMSHIAVNQCFRRTTFYAEGNFVQYVAFVFPLAILAAWLASKANRSISQKLL